VRLYEMGSWKLHTQLAFTREGNGLNDMIFSPDSSMVAVGNSPRGIHLFSCRTGESLATLESPEPATLARLEFSADSGTLAALQYNQAVQLWDLRRIREQLRTLNLDWPMPPYAESVAEMKVPPQGAGQ